MSFSNKKFLLIICGIAISFQSLIFVFTHAEQFFSRAYEKKYESYRKDYYSSQYVIKKNPVIIADNVLESFAGGAFLYGLNPILITHDHPPLGRYFISLSIALFGNQNTVILFVLAGSVIGVFLITFALSKNYFISLIPVGIFMNESLFLNKLAITPLLEPIQLPFIIFSIYFFIKAFQTKNFMIYFALTNIMLGIVISTRFFALGAALLSSMVIYLFIKQKLSSQTFYFILTLPLAILVLFVSYTRTIMDGYTLFQVLGIQEYILNYHSSKFVLPFTFWDLLLFNRWHTWWGNMGIIKDEHWTILWPLVTSIFFLGLLLRFFKKIKLADEGDILFIWGVLYMGMLSLGYTSTRYFLPLLPFLYIIATILIYSFFIPKKNRRNKKT